MALNIAWMLQLPRASSSMKRWEHIEISTN